MIYRMNSEKKKQNLSRKKIINSAITLFARKGFESTSTREICRHAGVNLSLIPYYFGNKEGLYIDIIESIINYGLTFLQDDIQRANQLPLMNTEEKIGLYKSLLIKYANFLYSENVPSSFVILMVKEQVVTHSKFSEVYSHKISVFYKTLRKILALIYGKKETDKAIIFEVSAIVGQILSFKFMDRATLTAFNQDFYTKDDNTKIKKIVMSYIETSVEKIETAAKALL